jgi:hypothetical protein
LRHHGTHLAFHDLRAGRDYLAPLQLADRDRNGSRTLIRNLRRARRSLGCAGIALYVAGAQAAPLLHILRDHAALSPVRRAQSVDPAAFTDPQTHDVDLARLAAALGLDGSAPHDESTPHSHTPGEAPRSHGPLDHGAGSIEHFGVALLNGASAPVVLERPAPAALPFFQLPPTSILPSARLFFAVQRAQAPPA